MKFQLLNSFFLILNFFFENSPSFEEKVTERLREERGERGKGKGRGKKGKRGRGMRGCV